MLPVTVKEFKYLLYFETDLAGGHTDCPVTLGVVIIVTPPIVVSPEDPVRVPSQVSLQHFS